MLQVSKLKKAEKINVFLSDWYGYEIVLKFDITKLGQVFFKNVSQVKTEEDFKVFHAKQNFG